MCLQLHMHFFLTIPSLLMPFIGTSPSQHSGKAFITNYFRRSHEISHAHIRTLLWSFQDCSLSMHTPTAMGIYRGPTNQPPSFGISSRSMACSTSLHFVRYRHSQRFASQQIKTPFFMFRTFHYILVVQGFAGVAAILLVRHIWCLVYILLSFCWGTSHAPVVSSGPFRSPSLTIYLQYGCIDLCEL